MVIYTRISVQFIMYIMYKVLVVSGGVDLCACVFDNSSNNTTFINWNKMMLN